MAYSGCIHHETFSLMMHSLGRNRGGGWVHLHSEKCILVFGLGCRQHEQCKLLHIVGPPFQVFRISLLAIPS